MTDNRILVTGAAGFVGSAVARALTAAGFRVRALVRPTSPRANLVGLDVEIAEGDMRDPGAVARAMAGARFVMHVAADYRLWAPDPNDILRANCDGTRIMMQAALKAGVERVVYTSSVATLAVSKSGESVDETNPLRVEDAIGAYKKSKILAEQIVTAMIGGERLPAVIVHPSTPIGPRDIKPTPTGRMIVEAARGRMPGYVDTGLNLVHVDDVADGHIAALQYGRIGEHYILGGENVSLAAMLANIAALSGRRAPRIRVPRAILYPLAFLAEARARRTGREPFLTRDGLRMSEYRMFFSSAKAERELGYRARPYTQALADALTWFRQHGYLQ
ncbi:MAG: hopanoid-associated sugar epimerase [Methylovirgula sp.]